jgi:hypothetical protein
MKKLGYCKHLISSKYGLRGDVPLPPVKHLMPFGGLELHNELLKGANLIIVNYQEKR